jgi:hypothetical protein
VIGVWLTTILVALAPAIVLDAMIAGHLGGSLMAESAAAGVNFDWWNEFLAQASGIGQTFAPAIIGFAAVLDNVSRVADARPVAPVLASLIGVHLLLSIFLAGGLLDRMARDRQVGPHAFFAACGLWFWRFLRLAIVAAPFYWWLFAYAHPWFFDDLYESWTHETSSERIAFVYRSMLYLVFAVLLAAINLVCDYAKIRAVVEDRQSMLGALAAGARFLRRNLAASTGLYALNVLVNLAVVVGYALAAPGASTGLGAFFVGQIYIVLRVVVRLQFVASQTALFQRRLAHSGYVARPVPRWPDSPSVEAVVR